MAVGEILNTTPVQPTAGPGQARTAIPPAQTPAALNPTPAAVTAAAELTPAQQAALLINETLQDLLFERPAPRDVSEINATNPLLSAIDLTEGLTPSQQAALLINETLLDVGLATPPPADALLINETSPLVETIAEAAERTPSQQAAEVVSETLQELGTTPPALTLTEVAARATATGGATAPLTSPPAAEGPTPVLPAATLVPGGVEVTAGPTPIATAVIPGVAVAPTPPPAVTSEAATLPPTQNLVATAATPPRDPTPFAFAVYEIRDQNPAPGDPKPTRRDLMPPLPPGRVRPVDRLVLKREWARRREGRQRDTVEEGASATERSILQVIGQANEDLIANGLPLRLVLARSEAGYCLDIYDCSQEDMCRLEQEVPLDLKELTTLLDNIQHETGIIINIKT